MVLRQDHNTAIGPPDLARGPDSRRWIGPALSPEGSPQPGHRYHDERCAAAESRASNEALNALARMTNAERGG
jgi:hypothetical protein